MAKKNNKKGTGNQQHLSPEKYLRSGMARRLEKGACFVSDSIEDYGEGIVVVSRNHAGGRVSFATYLIDAYCLGVKDTYYHLRVEQYEFEDFIENMVNRLGVNECSYEEAHNWVWGGVAWAEEAGIAPHKDFAITQFMLDDDTDDVPLIDLPFGKDGKHFLMANSQQELEQYLPMLIKNLGDDFDWAVPEDFTFNDNPLFEKYGPDAEYTYKHPDYPTSMELRTPQWVYDALVSTEHFATIEPDTLDRMLELPRADLRHDLEQIILYHTGLTCEMIPDSYDADGYSGVISKALILLGEVGDPATSLDVVLEVLRQNNEYYEYHLGDISAETITPTLYLLARQHLDKLMDFAKEEGLQSICKSFAFDVVTYIVFYEPERRHEMIEWCREMLVFATQELPHTQRFDSFLSGFLLSPLLDIRAEELLPEIRAMFDTGLVDQGACGDLNTVEKEIRIGQIKPSNLCTLDIHERFKDQIRWEQRDKDKP